MHKLSKLTRVLNNSTDFLLFLVWSTKGPFCVLTPNGLKHGEGEMLHWRGIQGSVVLPHMHTVEEAPVSFKPKLFYIFEQSLLL